MSPSLRVARLVGPVYPVTVVTAALEAIGVGKLSGLYVLGQDGERTHQLEAADSIRDVDVFNNLGLTTLVV